MFAPKAGNGACRSLLAVGSDLQGNSMAKPVVIVVGADKGGVGKTTVSRTLLDYFSANNVPTRAFDTESPRGTLKRFHPDITEIVDMTTTSDQMKIFDTLSAGPLGHRDRRPRRPVVARRWPRCATSAFSMRPRRARSPSPCSTSWAPRSPRWTKSPRPPNFMQRRQILPGEELHQRHPVLPVGPGDLQLLLPPHQGRDRPHHPQAQRNGLRAGRGFLGAVPQIRRQQGHRTTKPRTTRSCCAAMSGTGSPTSGASSTASS